MDFYKQNIIACKDSNLIPAQCILIHFFKHIHVKQKTLQIFVELYQTGKDENPNAKRPVKFFSKKLKKCKVIQ